MSDTLYQIMANHIGWEDDHYAVIYDGESDCREYDVDMYDIDDCLKYVSHKTIRTKDMPDHVLDVYDKGCDEALDEYCLMVTCIETDCNGNRCEITLYVPDSWH